MKSAYLSLPERNLTSIYFFMPTEYSQPTKIKKYMPIIITAVQKKRFYIFRNENYRQTIPLCALT